MVVERNIKGRGDKYGKKKKKKNQKKKEKKIG